MSSGAGLESPAAAWTVLVIGANDVEAFTCIWTGVGINRSVDKCLDISVFRLIAF